MNLLSALPELDRCSSGVLDRAQGCLKGIFLVLLVSLCCSDAGAQVTEKILKAFPYEAGGNPSFVMQGSDGALYGTLRNGGCSNSGALFRISTDASGFSLLHTFGRFIGDGQIPSPGFVRGQDGALYGTTTAGGANGLGTVFKTGTNGADYQVVHNFTSNDGSSPSAVIQGLDGELYGTCYSGGLYGYGSLFKMDTNGLNYTVLHHFNPAAGDGEYPKAGLLQGSDGTLYGTTWWDGSAGKGKLFKIQTDGTGYSVLHSFGSITNDGANPTAPLILGVDGVLYGTCQQGGTNIQGTVFRMNVDGSGYATLHSFAPTHDGANPEAALFQASNGTLYGTTSAGGSTSTTRLGTIFKVNTNGTGYAIVHSFAGSGVDGQYPYYAALIQAGDGMLYGASFDGGSTGGGGNPGLGALFKLNIDGSGYSSFYSFTYSGGDGQSPYGGLIQGSDGALYGTTLGGGGAGSALPGVSGGGVIFRMSTNGETYSVLHRFSRADGQNPYAALTEGRDGALYGTTYEVGSANGGTAFRMSLDGSSFSVLHNFNFTYANPEGRGSVSELLQGIDGALYGTTDGGGVSNVGTIFVLRTDGSNFMTLHDFGLVPGDGHYADAALIQGNDGALYGTCQRGGLYGNGTVFKLNTNGLGYAVLHNFQASGAGDGNAPFAPLLQGNDGILYGTTTSGGTNGRGTVFRMNPDGTGYSVIVSLGSTTNDGTTPYGSVVQGADAALYGTTSLGGSNNAGTIFKVNTDGSGYAVIYSFTPWAGDGNYPTARVIQGSDGALYGTTRNGSDLGSGSLLRLAGSLIAPVAVTNQPANLTNAIGETAVFSVGATSTLPIMYQWQKEGGAIFDGGNISGATTPALTLASVALSDSGLYAALITNVFGSVTSSGARLTVVGQPLFSGIERLPDGNIELLLTGTPNILWRIDTSTNLVDWTTLTNILAPGGTCQLIDSGSTSSPQRFYRAVWAR
jgi:uncharacterized repeat protein (TIGR03803 family)